MFETLDIILYIILSGILGCICALFSHLLDYCFWQGSIFSRYLPWLAKKLIKMHYPWEYAEVRLLAKELQPNEYIHRAEKIFLFKVLGGCSICTNIWIANISWVMISILANLNWYYIFPYVLTSSFFLRKISN